ncbi:C-type lectin domain family 2 member D-like isoform X2 [Paroedura picta]|uniref:C-type lectin domain family 2 member D-like isoform X2 n=1 Tax=Paroedura picta TaxID=143630 RepID=UPI0040577214
MEGEEASENSENVELIVEEISSHSAPAGLPSEDTAQNIPIWIIIFVSVTIVIITAFVVIYADVQVRKIADSPHCVPPCPPDWIATQRRCYYFSNEKRNWPSSQSFCLSQKANLLHFKPSLEKDFVLHNKGKPPSWIGLRKEGNHTWKWTNGEISTLQILGDGDCACLNKEGTLNAFKCRTELFWICQKDEAS